MSLYLKSLCSRFLRVRPARTTKGVLFGGYARSLGFVLRHRVIMLGAFLAVLVATIEMFAVVPKGFIPEQDNDQLSVSVRVAQGTSFYEMVTSARRVS